MERATERPSFGEMPLSTWENLIVFADDRVSLRSSPPTFALHRGRRQHWSIGEPINASHAIAHDWFDQLLSQMRDQPENAHSYVVVGDAGCGKSTLLKYLLLSSHHKAKSEGIIFSRFEFLKFWSEWRTHSTDLSEAISQYISYIHARDTIIDTFYHWADGSRLERDFLVRREEDFRNAAKAATNKVRLFSEHCGAHLSEGHLLQIEELFVDRSRDNGRLNKALRSLPHHVRVFIVGALAADKTLVTVFDGLDSVHIEDAFYETDEFKDLEDIFLNRRLYSYHPYLRDKGVAIHTDSIAVMRSNTAALLEHNGRKRIDHSFYQYFELTNVDPRTALLSVCTRAAAHIGEREDVTEYDRKAMSIQIMSIIRRTIIAVVRGTTTRPSFRIAYRLFDGNLRDLFGFICSIIEWHKNELLAEEIVSASDYTKDVRSLLSAISSEASKRLLLRRAYRVVELLLFSRGNHFENAVTAVYPDDDMFLSSAGRGARPVIRNNRYFSGQIDNVFNYIVMGSQDHFDRHAFLEKVRILQLCSEEPRTLGKVDELMKSFFGYDSTDLRETVLLLLKTDLLRAEFEYHSHQARVLFKTSNRGLLCIHSLIYNISYIEHVFHKTLFPKILVSNVNDKPRSAASRVQWVASSIRNAFIFCVYAEAVERNDASGQRVPERYRICGRLRAEVTEAVSRIVYDGSRYVDRHAPSGTADTLGTRVAESALHEIHHFIQRARKAGILISSPALP